MSLVGFKYRTDDDDHIIQAATCKSHSTVPLIWNGRDGIQKQQATAGKLHQSGLVFLDMARCCSRREHLQCDCKNLSFHTTHADHAWMHVFPVLWMLWTWTPASQACSQYHRLNQHRHRNARSSTLLHVSSPSINSRAWYVNVLFSFILSTWLLNNISHHCTSGCLHRCSARITDDMLQH